MSAVETNAGVAIRADENLRAFSSAWARGCDGDVWTNGDVLAATSGVEHRAYNQAFVLRRPERPLESFTEAREYLDALGAKYRLRALEALNIDEAVLAAAGLVRDGGIPTLALQPIDGTPNGPDTDIRPVEDKAMLAQLVDLVSASFEFPPDILPRVFTPALLDNPAWHGYVAYVDGTPAATSTLFVHERVAGIYYVGTLAQYRKRGLGEAVTRRCVVDGFRAGCDMASLQASPEGQPIYERMRFQHVGYYRTYIPKE